jgi:hypothetical protein
LRCRSERRMTSGRSTPSMTSESSTSMRLLPSTGATSTRPDVGWSV